MNIEKLSKSTVYKDLASDLKALEAQRLGRDNIDIPFTRFYQDKCGKDYAALMDDLGIDLNEDTISNLLNSSDYEGVRWLVPEIFREALRAGIRTAPIWSKLVVTEQSVRGKSVSTPWVNMSDAAPKKVNEGETIPLGAISVGSKSVSIYKIGRGIKITDEIKRYVNLNVVQIYFQDFGIKMGHAMDVLAIDVLLNGDQGTGEDAAAVVGVAVGGTLVYKDLLNIWVRAARMGRNFNTLITGETIGKDLLDLDEFKLRTTGTPEATLTLNTPVPRNANVYIHGNVPANQILMIDTSKALIKYNATGLLVESERIVSNQTEGTYATITTGFSKAFLDGSLILDKSLAFAGNGFPEYMEIDDLLDVVID